MLVGEDGGDLSTVLLQVLPAGVTVGVDLAPDHGTGNQEHPQAALGGAWGVGMGAVPHGQSVSATG